MRVMTHRALTIFVLCALILAACRRDVPQPDAGALLASAATRMEGVDRFHYVLEHEHGATTTALGFQILHAEGDVDGPERVQAAIKGLFGTVGIETGVVILDGQSWFQNPLTRRWEPQQLSIREIFDARSGVVAMIRAARSPRVTGTERLAGVGVHRVEAVLAAEALTLLPGALERGREVRAVAWIGVQDSLVYRVELRGPVATGEADGIVRRLTLSKFGEAVAIVPPR